MTIVICDDDIETLQQMEAFCQSLAYKDCKCLAYVDSRKLLSDIQNHVIEGDVYILDIDMPDINGIEIKNVLAQKGVTSSIIFLTSHIEMMQDAFGRNVVAFVSKGDWKERLRRELEKAYNEIHKFIRVECADGLRNIPLKEVISINADDYYSRLHIGGQNQECLLVKKSLKSWEKELPQEEMYRISRHVIINLDNVEKYDRATITMIDGVSYRLPKGTIKRFRDIYFAYVRKHERIL